MAADLPELLFALIEPLVKEWSARQKREKAMARKMVARREHRPVGVGVSWCHPFDRKGPTDRRDSSTGPMTGDRADSR
jgi:hypothetical protein